MKSNPWSRRTRKLGEESENNSEKTKPLFIPLQIDMFVSGDLRGRTYITGTFFEDEIR